MVWLLVVGCAWLTGRSEACRTQVEAVCEVCGDDSPSCSDHRRMLSVCEDDGTCQDQRCTDDHRRLLRDPEGYRLVRCGSL